MAYKQIPILGPYGGVVNNVPLPNTPLNSFDDVLNFWLRKGRMQGRPAFTSIVTSPDTRPIWTVQGFFDVNLNRHTLVLTDTNAYMLTGGNTLNLLNYPSGLTNLANGTTPNGLPYSAITALNRVYFSNGTPLVPLLYSDGSNTLQYAGDCPCSAFFIATLANQIILANTVEGGTRFPNRVRWSASGDPNAWFTYSAGFADLLNVPESLTGMVTLGRTGVLFRPTGISVFTPTGLANAPFAFEDLTYANQGVGNIYPFSLASYGAWAVFIANDDIYRVDSGINLTPIGTQAKKKIFTDLASAASSPQGFIVSTIGNGFDFMSYWLAIPIGSGNSVTWVYHFDEGSWVRMQGPSSTSPVTGLGLALTT